MVEIVDVIIASRDRSGAVVIDVDDRREDVADLLSDEAPHLGQMHVVSQRRIRRELARLLGDRCGMVAHPLEVVGDVVEREQEAQVARDRLLERDRPRDEAGDVALVPVERLVAA